MRPAAGYLPSKAGGYADLPMFDMLFGTFRNPQGFEIETGFYPSSRIVDMLLFKDLNRSASANQPAAATS